LLPKRADGLPALEKQLTLANLNKWIDAMQDSRVHIYLPKFKLDSAKLLERIWPSTPVNGGDVFGAAMWWDLLCAW
jgi:serine protease inhibitor